MVRLALITGMLVASTLAAPAVSAGPCDNPGVYNVLDCVICRINGSCNHCPPPRDPMGDICRLLPEVP